MMENPEPTEAEHELEGTTRHEEEDDMRGATPNDDQLPTEDDDS